MANSVYDEYALALYSLPNSESFYQSLKGLENLLNDKTFKSFFASPNINLSDKKDILKNSFSEEREDFIYFLYVLLDNERFLEIDKIVESYERILNEKKNILCFSLETAYELTDLEILNIKAALTKKYQKSVELSIQINKDIIGGIVLKQNGQIIDASVLNKLEALKESLKEMRN